MPTSIRELGWAELISRANTGLNPADFFKRDDLWAIRTAELSTSASKESHHFYTCKNQDSGMDEKVIEYIGQAGMGSSVMVEAYGAFEIIRTGDGVTPPGVAADAAMIALEQKVCGIRVPQKIIACRKMGLTFEPGQAEVPVAKFTLYVRMVFRHLETDPSVWA